MQWKLAGAGLLALGTVLAASGSAEAAQGCGPGFHRGAYGFCRPNPYRPFFRPYGFYRPHAYRPAFYGPRPWRGHGGWHHRW